MKKKKFAWTALGHFYIEKINCNYKKNFPRNYKQNKKIICLDHFGTLMEKKFFATIRKKLFCLDRFGTLLQKIFSSQL